MKASTSDHYTQATVCIPIAGNMVLLAEKQKKIGAGMLNGFGGKMEPGDTSIEHTNARETEEEIGIRVTTVTKVAEIMFRNPSPDKELKQMCVHFFLATAWEGEPQETDEMKKVGWHAIADLDYNRFLSGDRLFMPQILSGKKVKGVIDYNEDWSVRHCELEEVVEFSWLGR